MTKKREPLTLEQVQANGHERAAHDYYRTDPALVEQFLERWDARRTRNPEFILEPAAGDGAFLAPLRKRWPQAQLDAFDVAPQHQDVEEVNFFTLSETAADGRAMKYDLVITNPPFKHALQFAMNSHALLREGGALVLLLRLGFLASQARRSWMRRHMPERIYVLSSRPSFMADGGTDFSEYAWFVWRQGPRRAASRLEIL